MPNIDFSKVQEYGSGETLRDAMARVKASTSLQDFCEAHLEREHGNQRGRFVCPVCGSGGRADRRSDSAFSIKGERWKCFSAKCGAHGDIFDLAGILNNEDDRAEQLRIVAEWAHVDGWGKSGGGRSTAGGAVTVYGGLEIPSPLPASQVQRGYGWDDAVTTQDAPAAQVPASPKVGQEPAEPVAKREEVPTDKYAVGRARERAYVESMRANIEDQAAVAYLAARGIDLETARAWGLGYDPNAGGAKRADGSWCRRGRIVIPWAGSDYYHIDRSIAPDVAQAKYTKPKSEDVGAQPLWNRDALKAPAFFVVEGALDALAVEAAGGEAVALGGTGWNDLVDALDSADDAGMPIILLDMDEAGREASGNLGGELDRRGIVGLEVTRDFWSGEGDVVAKDAGEMWQKAPDRLRDIVRRALKQAEQRRAAVEEEKAAEDEDRYQRALKKAGIVVCDPSVVVQSVYLLKDAIEPVETTMARVDDFLGGGLYGAGLVVVGAVSGVGKTTLVGQWADYIAANGRPVVFVSIEQSAGEIVAKSLSRLMHGYHREGGGAITASADYILSAKQREKWANDDRAKERALQLACGVYTDMIAPNMRIVEPADRPTVPTVRGILEHEADRWGKMPILVVDYLQIMAPLDARMSDKQAVDENVSALRRMAKDLRTCVTVISSLNRANYNGAVTMESFKESGGIEYSSDQLIGLQPAGMEDATDETNEGKAKRQGRECMREYKRQSTVEVSLSLLKNRNGATPPPITLTYNKVCNLFTE